MWWRVERKFNTEGMKGSGPRRRGAPSVILAAFLSTFEYLEAIWRQSGGNLEALFEYLESVSGFTVCGFMELVVPW